jgi:hypothetical protein
VAALGTPHQSTLHHRFVVIESSGGLFQLLVGKKMLKDWDAYVQPSAQRFFFKSRSIISKDWHSLPVDAVIPSQGAALAYHELVQGLNATCLMVAFEQLLPESSVGEASSTGSKGGDSRCQSSCQSSSSTASCSFGNSGP